MIVSSQYYPQIRRESRLKIYHREDTQIGQLAACLFPSQPLNKGEVDFNSIRRPTRGSRRSEASPESAQIALRYQAVHLVPATPADLSAVATPDIIDSGLVTSSGLKELE